jgi:hypothetical protein
MFQNLITYAIVGAALIYVFFQAFRILGKQESESSSGCGGCSGCAAPKQSSKTPGDAEAQSMCKTEPLFPGE